VDLLRGSLSLFALLNAAGWAALAAAWKFRPEWAERLPLQLGTHERYLKAAPLWARLAAALTGFWTLAAALYLTAGHNTAPFIVIALFTAAAACLIIAIAAAGAVFSAVRPDPLPVSLEGSEQPL
jgi:peptidoglycan/LPS O-acetylase OafA/YrhL